MKKLREFEAENNILFLVKNVNAENQTIEIMSIDADTGFDQTIDDDFSLADLLLDDTLG